MWKSFLCVVGGNYDAIYNAVKKNFFLVVSFLQVETKCQLITEELEFEMMIAKKCR